LTYDAKNKRFILFGGYDGTIRYNDVWELSADSAYHRWCRINPSGTPPTAKNLAASEYVRGTTSGSIDKAYIVMWGGSIGASAVNEMHTLDVTTPGSEVWTTITQTNTPVTRYFLTHHMVGKTTATNTVDLYLFGSWDGTVSRQNDLLRCTFNVNTPTAITWTTLVANGAVGSPSGRSGALMVYDSANNRLIITSGFDGTTYLSDVWQYSISGGTFSQITPTGTAPGGRELGNIGYDVVNHRAILMGGWQGAASSNRNDVIQLSLASGSEAWTTIKANDLTNQAVAAWSSGSCDVDTSRNILVMSMIDGFDTAVCKYTYAFNLSDTTATAPLYSLNVADYFRARDATAYCYNSTSGEMILINGYSAMDDDATIANGDHVSEVWAYNRSTNSWRSALGGPYGVPQCEGALAVYDSANDRILVYGGLTSAGQKSGDVWQLKADVNGMYHPTKINPVGPAPPPRWLMAGCYDPVNQRMVITAGDGLTSVQNDTWALSLTLGSEAWTQLTPAGVTIQVWQPTYLYDASTQRLYIHAGCLDHAGTLYTGQLLYLDISTTNGTAVSPGTTGGTAVRGSVMALDSANSRLVCFGGVNGTTSDNTTRYVSTSTLASWTTVSTQDPPVARRSFAGTANGSYFVVATGRPVSGTWFNDTYELNFTAATATWDWTNKAPLMYQMMSVPLTGLAAINSYHWQGWIGNTTGISVTVSFGGNAESAPDFIVVGTGDIRVSTAAGWTPKPVKWWNGSAWVVKPLKQWNGSAWVKTNY
jgi:hypothetical protein